MRTLDRYIALSMLGPLLFGLGAFTSLFLSGDLLNLARLAVELGAPLGAVARVLLLRLPQILVWTLPMAVLLGTLLSLSRLSAASEIVAMRAAGVSFYRLSAPPLAIGALMSILSFTLNEAVVPQANFVAQRVMVEEIQGGQLPRVTRNVILRRYQGDILEWFLYAREFDGRSETMTDVTMVRLRSARPIETTYAERVVWGGSTWYMENGVSFLHGSTDQTVVVRYGEARQPVPIGQRPEEIAQIAKNPDQMTAGELRQHIAILAAQGQDVSALAVQWHQKFALPLASFVFALIGAPLGIQPHRSASSIGFGLSIIVIFVYYVIMSLGTALGQGGYLPPVVAAWSQDVLLGGVGLFLIRRAAR
ncbi:MAG TPA: LptF/LptG family permease [Limnochordia bacterium]